MRTFKRLFALMVAATSIAAGMATEVRVTQFNYTGPFLIPNPIMIDSVGFTQKKFAIESVLDANSYARQVTTATTYSGELLPGCTQGNALHFLRFTVENTNYAKATFKLKHLKHYKLYIDDKPASANQETALEPKTHEVVIKYLSQPQDQDSLFVAIDCGQPLKIGMGNEKQLYSMQRLMTGKRIYGVQLSPSGRYLITTSYDTQTDGRTNWRYELSDCKTGNKILETDEQIHWMPQEDAYYVQRKNPDGVCILVTDMANGKQRVLAERLPDAYVSIAPNARFLILTKNNQGPTDDRDVHEIVDPDDRQARWRNRSSLYHYDIATGVCRPLTFGFHNANLLDIAPDNESVLFTTNYRRLTARPTTLSSLYRLHLSTMKVDTLVRDDGFLQSACFSADGAYVILHGSPECLEGIGKNVPEGCIPNAYDYQLFSIHLATGQKRALTRNFNPSVNWYEVNRYDGKLYFTAEDYDYVHLYRMDIKNGKIEQIPVPEDLVNSVALAEKAPFMVWVGNGASNADRMYSLSTTNRKSTLLHDYHADRMGNIQLGTCEAWNFTASRGDTIYGRYYLPPYFDATKKYPLIVYYYGGCSPTERRLETHYPPHIYAAQGYVVYVINPSGATGFGQEFYARHVNTAGKGVADDIIEGTRRFAAEHSFINDKKIGCIGASYGGFMTQYLQTQTDLFAAAISHAGISNHTSYWGEGYWGYSYGEVYMANSYPWKDRQLFVDQSPLFNVDKIHTPILFLHGTADTNVPIGESIQMYTALKLLGREAAFVMVEGENHGIQNFHKRIKWQNTIFAWFAKWLKDDDSWWKAIYKPKNL